MRRTELYKRLLEIPEDRYLLHGSPHKLETIEPRKADFEEKPAFNQLGVYATNCVEIALAHALIHNESSEWGYVRQPFSSFLQIYVPRYFLHGTGFIYVLPKEGFERVASFTFIAREPIEPVEILPVDAEVLDELDDEEDIEVWLCDRAPA